MPPVTVGATAASSSARISSRWVLPAATAALFLIALAYQFGSFPRWAVLAFTPQSATKPVDERSLPAIESITSADALAEAKGGDSSGLTQLRETIFAKQITDDAKDLTPQANNSSGQSTQYHSSTSSPAPQSIMVSEPGWTIPDRKNDLCELPPEADSAQPFASVSFGEALARAAEGQTTDFVVYTDKYRALAFPMGDVPTLFGVCTDVVIRAYRTLGIDLQALVYRARKGAVDRSIAHRRTITLRRFFASQGASRRISEFPEDYLPGDIVTYDRPQNRGSRDHIAIVSNQLAPSGRPMIVHNRGWGPQIEDALFVDKITGHYRYRGPEPGDAGVDATEPGPVRNAAPRNIRRRTGKLELPKLHR